MGSPVSPIVVNLFSEQFEPVALYNHLIIHRHTLGSGMSMIHGSSYRRSNSPRSSITSTVTSTRSMSSLLKEGKLAFLDCLVTIQSDGTLAEISVYRDTHTDQYLLFDSHHPLIHTYPLSPS